MKKIIFMIKIKIMMNIQKKKIKNALMMGRFVMMMMIALNMKMLLYNNDDIELSHQTMKF